MEKTKSDHRKEGRACFPSGKERDLRARQVIDLLMAQPRIQTARQIGVFVALDWEVPLSGLWEEGLRRFVFPKVTQTGLVFYQLNHIQDLVPGFAGILEPADGTIVSWQSQDVVLVPGSAFDRKGGRIGSGKGYYDRFFAQLKEEVWRVGVCWKSQIFEGELPQEDTDFKMHQVCCESELLEVAVSS